ncbi:MAG TPA: copper transporter [Solirubrobacteraceae bacterium]|nr:copper transporter [Solirubrobacteraceae bacterium]
MFDYRYHALSLAAVLLALAVGVLIGVAIGDSNLVSSAKSGIVHELQGEVAGAHHQIGQLQDQLAEQEAFANGLYPLAAQDVLKGRQVGLVFLGGSSDTVAGLVRSTVGQAGGAVATVAAVREPLDLAGIGHAAAGTRYASLAGSPQAIERFGELVGRQLLSGGRRVDGELLGRVRSSLFSAFDGRPAKLDGLVVMRVEPPGMSATQSEAIAAFQAGLLAGAAAKGTPAVGVELSSTAPSQAPWYKSRGLSSVDDLETPVGRTALVYALAGAHGTFGIKPTAEALLPSASR